MTAVQAKIMALFFVIVFQSNYSITLLNNPRIMAYNHHSSTISGESGEVLKNIALHGVIINQRIVLK